MISCHILLKTHSPTIMFWRHVYWAEHLLHYDHFLNEVQYAITTKEYVYPSYTEKTTKEGNEHTPDPHLPFTLQNTMSSPWPCREPLSGVGHRLRGLWGLHLGCGHGVWDSGCPPQAPGQPGPAGNSYSSTAPPSSLRSGRSSILKETEHRDRWQ
jgi:hypothetical protein